MLVLVWVLLRRLLLSLQTRWRLPRHIKHGSNSRSRNSSSSSSTGRRRPGRMAGCQMDPHPQSQQGLTKQQLLRLQTSRLPQARAGRVHGLAAAPPEGRLLQLAPVVPLSLVPCCPQVPSWQASTAVRPGAGHTTAAAAVLAGGTASGQHTAWVGPPLDSQGRLLAPTAAAGGLQAAAAPTQAAATAVATAAAAVQAWRPNRRKQGLSLQQGGAGWAPRLARECLPAAAAAALAAMQC